jgi:hypothetical protein
MRVAVPRELGRKFKLRRVTSIASDKCFVGAAIAPALSVLNSFNVNRIDKK